MLTHHSSQDYNVAASEAAKEARTKFEAEIARGKERALAVIEQVHRDVPQDRIVNAKKLDFFVESNDIKVRFPDTDRTEESFHRHAVQQAASRADIPLAFIDNLMKRNQPWAQELVAENLNRIYHNTQAKKYLTRSVQGQVRGFLSDAYRRLDSRPLLESFLTGMNEYGAVPVDGYALETKVAVKMVLPHVFEPVPHEVMIFGAAYENSDFGNGKVSVRTFVERLWCTNRAISTEDLSQVHLGARLPENLTFSQHTYELDTKTMASAVKDIMGTILSPESVNQRMALIQQANEQKIEGRNVNEFLKKHLLKGEAADVIEAFNSADVEMLPAGNNVWRMSNAISWIANTKIQDEERKLEVMKVAGAILDAKLPAAA